MFEQIDVDTLTLDVIEAWFRADLSAQAAREMLAAPHSSLSGRPEFYGPQTEYEANKLYYEGDHWQGSTGWSGQIPYSDPDARTVDALAMERIRLGFVSENVIAEVTDRHVTAVVGRSPVRRLYTERPQAERTEGQQPEADPLTELNEEIGAWARRRDIVGLLQKYARTLLLGRKASLRVFIPPGKLARMAGMDVATLTAGTVIPLPPGLTFAQALDLIRVEVVEPGEGGVHEDPNTGDRFGAVVRKGKDGRVAEVSHITDNGNTTRVVIITEEGERYPGTPMPLDGHLTLYTRERRPLITEQVRQLQRLHNKALTMLGGNLDWSGFLERIFFNAQPVMERVRGTDGVERNVARYHAGPGTATFLTGTKTVDEQGNERVATPSVVFREPIRPDVFEATIKITERRILSECFQLHALISGDAAPSGESRIQAKADWVVSLMLTKPHLDGAGRWLFEVLYRMAAALSGTAVPTNARTTFRTLLDPGPLSGEEVKGILERVKARLLSRSAALSELRTEDVDAELQAIDEDALASKEWADTLNALGDAGFPVANALRLMGVSEERIEAMLRFEEPTPTP
jgi:hypothetical protein